MPDVNWNAAVWNGAYDWSNRGEEWSGPWGGSEAQWFGAIYPRIHRFLPAQSILEIAPGFGRWSRFLLPSCEQYTGVDLSAECVAACRETFSPASHATFFENDGTDLSMVPDASVDFAFSFDSLVHVEMNVIDAYVSQLVPKLREGGAAFLHHSNVKATASGRDDLHHRGADVSHQLVADVVIASGGKMLVQETLAWTPGSCIDCISLFSRSCDFNDWKGSFVENAQFMVEANLIREHLKPYAGR
jgi:hypothetical protein